MRKKILFFETEAWERDWLVKNLGGFTLQFFDYPLDERRIPLEQDAAVICVGQNSVVSKRVLEAFSRLELVCVRFNECANIDFTACRERAVSVCRAPSRATHAVAEFTFALILALSRRICQALDACKTGNASYALRGFDLAGKTLGVLGAGNIGSNVVRIARGFGMKVLAYNRKPNAQLAAELGFAYATPEDLMAHAHVLTLHLPYHIKSTHHIIDRAAFSHMRRGIHIVNTAHEKLIDSQALLWALEEGIVAGYATDVAKDPADMENLRRRGSVLFTPNTAWNTQEALEHLLRISVDNIRAYFSGFPQNCMGEISDVK